MTEDEDDFFSSIRPKDFIFDGYRVFGNRWNSFAVSHDVDPEYLRRLLAANASYPNYSSVDYVLKRYVDSKDLTRKISNETALVEECCLLSKQVLEPMFQKGNDLSDLPDHFGLVASGVALMRLQSSFSTARFLLSKGLVFEYNTICRLILEQIAWSYQVRDIEDDSLYDCRPTNAISKLKDLISISGKFYGILSKIAHIDTSQIRRLVSFEKSEIQVILASRKDILIDAVHILMLADWYCVVMEINYREFFTSFDFVIESGGAMIPNKDRQSLKTISSMVEKIHNHIKDEKAI